MKVFKTCQLLNQVSFTVLDFDIEVFEQILTNFTNSKNNIWIFLITEKVKFWFLVPLEIALERRKINLLTQIFDHKFIRWQI